MKIPFFDISRQYKSIQAEIEKAVTDFLPSCAYIGGPQVQAFEKQMADYLGVKHVISCGNGTDALKLALRSVGVKPGDEVITTPFSFFATSEAIAAIGATPVFADIRLSDLNIDPAQIERHITSKTKVILPVHIFGAACAMDEINAIAQKYNLKVVEDACQAIGSEYHGRKVGNLGDVGCFSFYPTKNLGAFGDGGMVTTNSDEIAVICSALKSHGSGKNGAQAFSLLHHENVDQYLPKHQAEDGLYDPYKYYNFLIGENSRLDALQAVILSCKLAYLDEWNNRRQEIAQEYSSRLSGLPLQLCNIFEKDSKSAYHQFVVLSPKRDALSQYLKEKGIGVGTFYPVPLHKQFAHAYQQPGVTLPVAEDVCTKSFCLPVYPELTPGEQTYIIDTIHGFFQEAEVENKSGLPSKENDIAK